MRGGVRRLPPPRRARRSLPMLTVLDARPASAAAETDGHLALPGPAEPLAGYFSSSSHAARRKAITRPTFCCRHRNDRPGVLTVPTSICDNFTSFCDIL